MGVPSSRSVHRTGRATFAIVAALAVVITLLPSTATAQGDPREGLRSGFQDAEQTSLGVDLLGSFDKRDSNLFDPDNIGSFAFANSDLAFTGDFAIQGNFAGFQVFDVSDPSQPTLRTEVLCPGGQGDPSVWGDLLFISVEQTNGRIDCGTQGNPGGAQPDRMRGIRIFDISDIDDPVQVGYVQTCRGSHTHRVVEDLSDPSRVFVYNHGTAGVRSSGEMERCNNQAADGPDPARWMVEVIEVPLDAPHEAAIVNEARLFADPDTGALNGLQNGPTQPLHPSGSPYGPQPNTNTCHDITVYPEVGLAAGACQGNGILIDISDPSDPQRLDAVADVNFSYWHSANFNNAGTAVMFTDEWGGGTGARCRASDQHHWGANALFDIVQTADGPKLEFASYYKMPAVQTNTENCVAHQANVVPVPGRDIIVQAWYQGGISMFDWTDPSNPFEIGYFDRGPISDDSLILGGFWSGYWYNGHVYGSEIARGLDAFALTPTADLTANEIAAASTVRFTELNPMSQFGISWEPSFALSRAYLDQLVRSGDIAEDDESRVSGAIDRAERFRDGPQRRAAAANLEAAANSLEEPEQAALASSLRDLAATMR